MCRSAGPTRRYYQHINRYSASFALITDAAMFTLGGELKRRELLSARLGDILSYLYLASMVLKHYQDQGEPPEDLPLVEWSCRTLLYKTQEQFHGLLRNFPNRWVAAILRFFIFPRGRTYSAPSDELGQQIVELIINPTATRERLADGIYKTVEPGNQIGLLQQAMEIAEQVKPLERRVFDARRAGDDQGRRHSGPDRRSRAEGHSDAGRGRSRARVRPPHARGHRCRRFRSGRVAPPGA